MANPDFTKIAVTRQLNAMGCREFEVGVFDRDLAEEVDSKPMALRFWTGERILKAIKWLKIRNFQGCDIFIRPAGSSGLVFFDDLNLAGLGKLAEDGLAPAIVIESSPGNFHGWIRVSEKAINEDLATAVCKVIATRYGGDVDSADWRHFGRLAGYTNRKKKYIDINGNHPFVKMREGKGSLCVNADFAIEEGRAYLIEQERIKAERIEKLRTARANGVQLRDGEDFFLSELNGLRRRYGNELNRSKADWVIIKKMAEKGYERDQIESAMWEHSEKVSARGPYADKYVDVTLDSLFGA